MKRLRLLSLREGESHISKLVISFFHVRSMVVANKGRYICPDTSCQFFCEVRIISSQSIPIKPSRIIISWKIPTLYFTGEGDPENPREKQAQGAVGCSHQKANDVGSAGQI